MNCLFQTKKVSGQKIFGVNFASIFLRFLYWLFELFQCVAGRLGRDRMVVGLQLLVQSAHITTKVVSSTPVHGEVYSIKHYVIKFVSDL